MTWQRILSAKSKYRKSGREMAHILVPLSSGKKRLLSVTNDK